MKYNHKGKNVFEATGVDALKTSLKAGDLFPKSGEVDSHYIETLENTFNKRELAVLSSMFMQEMNKRGISPTEEMKIEVVSMNKESIPTEVLEFIKDNVRNNLDNIEDGDVLDFDSNCPCPECTRLRAEAKSNKETSKDILGGEGGDC